MKKIKSFFAILMFLSGVCVAAYPVISNILHEKNATQVIETYNQDIKNMDQEKIDSLKEAAKKYNEQLSSAVVRDQNGEAEEEGVSYVDMINIGESIGYITIPKIDVNLPIYKGTNDDVLARGVGYMEQSSYPLGGESTHSVLTGHRGLPDAVLFSDMDKMEEGDCFYLHVLDEVLAYRVDQIKVVEPNETGDLDIVEGEDLCTLVTCTPYAVNTHRLLVRGIRTEYTGEEEESQGQYQELRTGTVAKRMLDVWPWLVLALIVVFAVEGLILALIIRRNRRREDS